MYVKIDTNTVSAEQKNIEDSINDFNVGITNIKNTISDISSVWQGNDYNNFNTKINEFIGDLTSFKETLSQYSEFLKEYSLAVDKLDDYYGNKKINLQ